MARPKLGCVLRTKGGHDQKEDQIKEKKDGSTKITGRVKKKEGTAKRRAKLKKQELAFFSRLPHPAVQRAPLSRFPVAEYRWRNLVCGSGFAAFLSDASLLAIC